MDPWSPKSLQDLCIDSLAKTSKRADILWTRKKRPLSSEPRRVEWKDPELFLNSDIADKLLERLSYKQKLDDSILCTFTNRHVHLQNVRIGFCRRVTGWGLRVLRHHKLISLHIYCPREMDAVCTMLNCIGDKSYETLQHLGLWRNCEEWPSLHYDVWPADDDFVQQLVVFETLSRFSCLQSLDVRGTNLTDTNLVILGKSLPHVENLDLSWNSKITDISPLKNCQKTLKSLSLCELYDIAAESTLATFVTLSGLIFLDMSMRIKHDSGSRNVFTASILLQTPDVLPSLVCLDLSCRTVKSEHALRQFLDAHQSLQSLMLWGTPACEFKTLQDYRPRLTVGGDATLEQFTAALRHYNRTFVDYDYCKRVLVDKLYLDLDITSKPFPPCLDDQLVQELLDSIPGSSCFVSDKRVGICASRCLMAIAALLKKGIVTHLEPDTKQHLILFCQRAIQQCTKIPSKSLACQTAVQILRSLGEPEPPHRD